MVIGSVAQTGLGVCTIVRIIILVLSSLYQSPTIGVASDGAEGLIGWRWSGEKETNKKKIKKFVASLRSYWAFPT